MNRPKFTFGKIQLNAKKSTETTETQQIDTDASTSGKVLTDFFPAFVRFLYENLIYPSILMTFLIFFGFTGFGTFGKHAEIKNSLNEAIEELADDLENQQVQEIMGISEFGRKAKTFDITVS